MGPLIVALKDAKVLLRKPGSLLLTTFLLPILFIMAFSLPTLIGSRKAPTAEVALVDGTGGSPATLALMEQLAASEGVRFTPRLQAEAEVLFQAGDAPWVLEIPADFASAGPGHPTALRLRVHDDANLEATDTVRWVLRAAAQRMALDTAISEVIAAGGEGIAAEALAQAESQQAAAQETSLISLQIVSPGETPMDLIGTSNLVVPAFAVLFVFLHAQSTAMSIVEEKLAGTFRRILATPLHRWSLLAGKLLLQIAHSLVQLVLVFIAAMLILPLIGLDRLNQVSHPEALLLLMLLVALCSAALGLLIAAIVRRESQVSGLAAVVLWMMGALGGCFYPTFLMSGFLQSVSSLVPHSWALRAFNDVLVYNRGLPAIAPEVGVLAAFTVVFAAIGVWQFRFE